MRQLYRSSVALIAATGIVVSLAVSAAASTGGAPGDASSVVGAAPTVPIGARATGAAPANEQVSFDVVLRPRDQRALDSFVASVSTPGSPSYHQFLTAAQFTNRFGPTTSTIASVRGSLQSLGLTVGGPTGSVLTVSGTVSKVGSAFKTSFRHYRLATGRVARANVAAPQLPNTIVGAVQGVVGLDDLAQFSHPVPKASPALQTPALSPHLTGPGACTAIAPGGTTYYVASQLASYYGLDASYAAGTLGAGVTVAVVELEPFATSDIAAYKTCYGTTTTVTTTTVDGGPSGGQAGEAALDIEDIIGLAPAATVHVYQGPNAAVASDTQVLDLYGAIANDSSLAQVVSTSWGQCEASAGTSFVNSENVLFEQMAAQGQTVFAASGDSGSADCANNQAQPSTGLAVDDPASQPYVTGVGGTDLTSTSGPENVWNNGSQSSAGGGGVSSKWQMPAWQTAVGTIAGSGGTPCHAPAGTLCREVPDVSASSDPNDGYPIFWTDTSPPGHSGWWVFGGTSAAAPTWAALTALIDSSCGNHKLGLINPALYQLRAAGTSDFHDVTSGNNDGAGTNNGAYAAAPGYDMATGLGTPQGGALRTDLCPAVATDGSGTMTVNHTTVGVATHTTLQFTYTAPAGHALTNGELKVTPSGWSPPSTSPGAAGYTTASAGNVTISAGAIDVTGVTTIAGGTVVITYGDTTGGGPGTIAPSSAGTSVFSAAQRGTTPGTLTTLASPPQVLVGTAPDGSGTMSVTPSSVAVTTPTTLSFTYTPPTGTALTAGAVAITIPAGWTPPQVGSNAAAGFVTSNAGTPTISGGTTIVVDPVTVAIGATLSITYGNAAAHASAAAVPPSSATTSMFSSQQRGTSGGALTALANPPSIAVGGGASSSGGGAVASQLNLLRVSGPDRIGTSVAASQTGFPTATSAQAVVLARSDAFADALAGTPLAVSKHGPLLLTGSGSLAAAAATEIQRVLAPGASVYLLGGTSALSPAVASAVAALGHPVVRVSGSDRFATAVQVAALLGNPGIVFEADGTTFPDALSAGSAAAESGGVILLTSGPSQSGPTAAYIAAHPGSTRYSIGGPAAAADPLARSFVGSDRFATSVLVAQAFFAAPGAIALASGISFPDALSGGSVAAMNHGPVLLVPSSGALPASLATYLATAKDSATAAWLFGGTASVSAQVFGEAASALATTP